jgi:hypothetical protein
MQCPHCKTLFELSPFCPACGMAIGGRAGAVTEASDQGSSVVGRSTSVGVLREPAARPSGRLRTSICVLIVVCFLMPFVTISCPATGQRVSVSGFKATFGAPATASMPEIKASTPRVVSFLLALLGLGLAAADEALGRIGARVIGGVSFVLLLIFRSGIDASLGEARGIVVAESAIGYWLALAGYLALGATGFNFTVLGRASMPRPADRPVERG